MISFSLIAPASATAPDTLLTACGPKPGVACHIVWDLSHDRAAATLVAGYLAGPLSALLRIAFVVILALIVRAVTHRLIARVTVRAATSAGGPMRRRGGQAAAPAATEGSQVLFTQRRQQRAYALGSILRSIASTVILGIAGITILGDLGVNLAPVLASAGVVGVAVGFGAQSLVRDFLSGIFMLVEDQYGVGDVIDVGEATGTVEAVGLRITRLRDVNGIVWHVRNGAIDRIGNESQSWSRAVIDLPVGGGEDVGRVRLIMKEAAAQMWSEPAWRPVILEEPAVWGVQALSGTAVVMRLVAKTVPLQQWQVARELRERLKIALDEHHVALAPADGASLVAPDRAEPTQAEIEAGHHGAAGAPGGRGTGTPGQAAAPHGSEGPAAHAGE